MIIEQRVGVLYGGRSREREISLRTGQAILNTLTELGLDVVGIDVDERLPALLVKEKVEVALIALHGRLGEDGTIQGLLEAMSIPYSGSGVLASALALDKIRSKRLFSYHNLPTPPFIAADHNCVETLLRKQNGHEGIVGPLEFVPTAGSVAALGYPLVVKPASEGSTIGITIVQEPGELEQALEQALEKDQHVLLEAYIEGREITVGILDDRPLAVIEIIPESGFYDYQAKYLQPTTKYLVPAPISDAAFREAQRVAGEAHDVLGCHGFSRVDLRLSADDQPYILEVNTIPGLTETSLLPKAAAFEGIDFQSLVLKLLATALSRR